MDFNKYEKQLFIIIIVKYIIQCKYLYSFNH
jgi:hypothetical protein